MRASWWAEAGAHILNDVSGFTDDAMIAVAAEFGLPGIVMHMRGKPKHHREVSQQYDDVGGEVRAFLVAGAAELRARGVEAWLDPGFEFGKTLDDNVRLYEDLPNLVRLGRALRVLDVDAGIALPRRPVNAVAAAVLSSSPEELVADPAQIRETNVLRLTTHPI